MRHSDCTARVADILEAIHKIGRHVTGMNQETFSEDEKTIDAVIRNLTVIGEAARHVPAQLQQRYPRVPWDEMRAIRNIVVHEYFGVSIPIVWHTVQENLPPVAHMLEQILQQHGENRRE